MNNHGSMAGNSGRCELSCDQVQHICFSEMGRCIRQWQEQALTRSRYQDIIFRRSYSRLSRYTSQLFLDSRRHLATTDQSSLKHSPSSSERRRNSRQSMKSKTILNLLSTKTRRHCSKCCLSASPTGKNLSTAISPYSSMGCWLF